MNYYILTNNWDYDCLKKETIPIEYDRTSLNLGLSFDFMPPIELTISSDSPPNHIPNHQQYLFFDEKIKKVLEKYETEYIQYFEAKVLNLKMKTNKYNYSVLNIRKIIDAIDIDKSELDFDEEDGDITFVDKLQLKNHFNDAPIFRLKEVENLTVIREDLVSDLKKIQCTG